MSTPALYSEAYSRPGGAAGRWAAAGKGGGATPAPNESAAGEGAGAMIGSNTGADAADRSGWAVGGAGLWIGPAEVGRRTGGAGVCAKGVCPGGAWPAMK